jgi:xanthine dehydrogenase accessory factor
MTGELLAKLQEARDHGKPCVMVTVAQTRGSVPREAGAKMLVYPDGKTAGSVGGGKFESLVIEASLAALGSGAPVLKTYPLHERDGESFGAICGGEVTVLIEPQAVRERLVLVGAGHCARAIARLAAGCGMHVTVLDDRAQLATEIPEAHRAVTDVRAPEFIGSCEWGASDALVMVSRNFEIDREALAAALQIPVIGYTGMIGSMRKVQRVFDELRQRGVADDQLARVFAPIGLDIGADSPEEIAVSVVAEILQVLRGRTTGHLRDARKKSAAADACPPGVAND